EVGGRRRRMSKLTDIKDAYQAAVAAPPLTPAQIAAHTEVVQRVVGAFRQHLQAQGDAVTLELTPQRVGGYRLVAPGINVNEAGVATFLVRVTVLEKVFLFARLYVRRHDEADFVWDEGHLEKDAVSNLAAGGYAPLFERVVASLEVMAQGAGDVER